MLHVGIAFQVAVNLLLMVEVVSQRRVKLRLREVRQTLENLIRRHAELIITRHRPHRDARAFDDGHATGNPRVGRDVGILDGRRFHGIKLAQPADEASFCWATDRASRLMFNDRNHL